ncbi:ABC transporter ATP-binding protein [Trichlorobacter lovleyi]|uniref:ABC transporter related n=1 Tax=Trichlorobacter lovleyi (strain ATCC BAA-1151 / DSM 17278 / SZ) TaxID=398767 RepID=B3EA13_TRIL1|nr:ABC transporter ATP-binding protein [Trichlorobacter lovleyi]ACD96888.1 ABC transporter related [Trichlorobacter lovleyi SZ]
MIELINVHKSFGSQTVLNGLNLTIPAGRITAVIGPSGEGKSVLLKHMIGLLQPDRGDVLVDGTSIVGLRRSQLNQVREKFAMVFQNAALFDSMTVYENVAFPLEEKTSLSTGEIADRVAIALQEVGLKNANHKYPDELSGGMKKRVGLARALLLQPQVVLFDEPTTGLDPVIRRAIHQLIKETQQKFGFTAVIVSHDIPDIFDVAHHIAMLYRGEILQFGTPDEIQASDHPVVRQFISGSLDGPINSGVA